jgi:shikimate dehydrogenase
MTLDINDRYCVFGNPIAHSKSPLLHTLFARQTLQNISYTSQHVDTNDFSVAATDFFNKGGRGLNVTVPFKHDAFNFADSLTARALRAGAVNTLFINDNNMIVGDNTDGVGLVTDLTQHLCWQLTNKKILIMGAGGAVRGILEPIVTQSPHAITIVNRTKEKAHVLACDFSDIFPVSACSYDELRADDDTVCYDLIINASSASLTGEVPHLPDHIINKDTRCYDLMYAPDLTPFLLWAKATGSEFISDGLGMLVCQGAESFRIWRGVKPDTSKIALQLRKLL